MDDVVAALDDIDFRDDIEHREQAVSAAWRLVVQMKLDQAIADDDLISAVAAAMTFGLLAASEEINDAERWASMARRVAESFVDPNREIGTKNRQVVAKAHKAIVQGEPGITHKQLMSRLREATGLKDRAIYKHLPKKPRKKSTARR